MCALIIFKIHKIYPEDKMGCLMSQIPKNVVTCQNFKNLQISAIVSHLETQFESPV